MKRSEPTPEYRRVQFSPLLFFISVSEVFSGVEAEKFNFAEYDSLLINADIKVDMDGRKRTTFLKFMQWRSKSLFKIKNESAILVPIDQVDGNIILHKTGSKTVTVSDNCRILSKELDAMSSSKSHETNLTGRAQCHFQALAVHVGLKWGLSPRTMSDSTSKLSGQKFYTQRQCLHEKTFVSCSL